MKVLLISVSILCIVTAVFAQSPSRMSYQAAVRTSSNELVANQAVGLRLSLLQGSVSGVAVYSETQQPITNSNGLFSVELGGGNASSGSLNAIDWENGPYFLQTELDITGGSNFSILGTTQLLSVPYALYAENGGGWSINQDTTLTFKRVGIGTNAPENGVVEIVTNSSQSNLVLTGSDSFSGKISLGNANTNLYYYLAGRANEQFVIGTYDGSNGDQSNLLTLTPNGNFGFMNANPQRTLHVNDVMRLEPRSTAPLNPSKGDIYFDNTLNKLRVYDGSTWQNCW
jgi:hypothetical protein